MTEKTIRFSAIDTLFFKESRPMDSTGELQSIFPPSMRTLAGAIRSWIGEQEQVNWHEFKENKQHSLREIIGSPEQDDNLGQLSFKGAWLNKDGERLYPTPLHLMKKEDEIVQLSLSEKTHCCDLGKHVRLPQLAEADKGSKPLENTWINKESLEKILHGELPSQEAFIEEGELFCRESRIGIARNNNTRTVKEGMLYQTQHIRPEKGVTLEVDVTGLPEKLNDRMIRLGGEARSSHLKLLESQAKLPQIDTINDTAQGLIIYLLTPLLMQAKEWPLPSFKQVEEWPLPSFKQVEEDDKTTYWQGKIQGLSLKLYGAVTGKVLREGGWNMAEHHPREMKSLIPAGSVFYCTTPNADIATAIKTLHDTQIGELQKYGYGHIAVGIWK